MDEQQPRTVVQVQPASPEPGSVMVTPKDMYDDIQQIKLAVVDLPGRVSRLEAGLDMVKARVWFMAGAAAALGTGAGAAAVKLSGG